MTWLMSIILKIQLEEELLIKMLRSKAFNIAIIRNMMDNNVNLPQ